MNFENSFLYDLLALTFGASAKQRDIEPSEFYQTLIF